MANGLTDADSKRNAHRAYFGQLKGPRKVGGKSPELVDIIGVTVCAEIAGADEWIIVERFGKPLETSLRTFLGLPNGIPMDDSLDRYFALMNPEVSHIPLKTWLRFASAR